MTPKKTLNLAVPAGLLEQFNTVCRNYGHGKQKGMVLSAAILMFLKADPKDQGVFLHEVMAADIAAGVKKMLADRVEESRRADPARPVSKVQPRPEQPRKAAKRAGKAVKAITRLPRLEDFQS